MKMILAESACALVYSRRRKKAVMGRDEGKAVWAVEQGLGNSLRGA